MAAAIKSAQNAAASAINHPQPSEDVVMVSADPILIVNSHDQPAIESAEIRTEIAMSGLTISGPSAPDSFVKYAIMASLPSPRMDVCHLSEDVKLFASNFKTSGDTFDFKQFMDSKAQRNWLILNDAEFKLFNYHHVLQVPRLKESGGRLLNWKIHQSLHDAIYHMIYLTVAHCIRHGSPPSSSDLTTVYTIVSGVMLEGHLQHFEEEDLYGIKSLNLKSHAPGHLRLSSFMDQIQIMRAFTPLLGSSGGPSELMAGHMSSTMSQCQYQIDMSANHSAASSVIVRQGSTSEFIRSCVSITLTCSQCSFKVHLVKRWSSSTRSQSSRSSHHSMSRLSSSHLILKVLIRWHHNHCQQVQHQALVSHHQASCSSSQQ